MPAPMYTYENQQGCITGLHTDCVENEYTVLRYARDGSVAGFEDERGDTWFNVGMTDKHAELCDNCTDDYDEYSYESMHDPGYIYDLTHPTDDEGYHY